LLVLHPGASSTIQDRGRFGFRSMGVPVDGPFDRTSHAIANALVSNDPDAATIEMTLYGGSYRALCPLAMALAGAPMATTVEGPDGVERPISIPSAFPLPAGGRLTIRGCETGARAYLATRGGFLTERILGSRCRSVPLRQGESLPAEESTTFIHRLAIGDAASPIRILEGPEARACHFEDWIGRDWQVGMQCDRVGVRLEGPERIVCDARPDGHSVPVVPGAVQVAGGFPIILGPSCGTMGGYSIAAVVISADLDRVGQLRPGQCVRFSRVTTAEARRLDEEGRMRLGRLCDRVRRRVLWPAIERARE
jgi:biotin-dependent carboxylase-like uncharacterized protein